MALWSGRFTENVSEFTQRFGASLPVDKALYAQDIAGSKAHAAMLGSAGVIAQADADAIVGGLDRVQERYYDTGIAFQRFSILTSSFLSSCGMLVSYLCLGWGAYRLWQGRIDFGTMVLFLQLASYLSSSLSALIHLVPSAIEASVSARRIMSVLELPRERLDHPERAQRLVREGVPLALSLQGLEVSYQSCRCSRMR